ncbi:MAG: imidazoleglycerol-phosphate dehydratase HisB [Proteobacteria bacterium SW_6_67_9]|nr:MAG: imidazoleglycerol-phosphate dehydratase HisB [Proteobacteria bacterium SW_6_67_9]
MTQRSAEIQRATAETSVRAAINLDGTGEIEANTGIGFFDHMLAQVARHGLLDLKVQAQGDLDVDGHHTVEDVGIVVGQAIAQALAEARGITRYGHAYVPLDEALSRVVVDLSGRPGLYCFARFERPRVGDFDTELVHEFFQGVANHARCTLHMDVLRGDNVHHMLETLFKAFGRALHQAVALEPRIGNTTPSTKGRL